MDKHQWFDELLVDSEILTDHTDWVEDAVESSLKFQAAYGINGGITIEAAPADGELGIVAQLTVTAGAVAIDPQGRRIVPTSQLVQMFVDKDGNPITPPAASNSKVIRVFAEYARNEQEETLTDTLGTIFFHQLDGVNIFVKAGADFLTSGGTPSYPAATGDEIILGDVTIPNGATQVLSGYISQDNATWLYKTTGGVPANSVNDLIDKQNDEVHTYFDFDFDLIVDDELNLGADIQTELGNDTLDENLYNTLAELIMRVQLNSAVATSGANYIGLRQDSQWVNGDYASDSSNTGADPGAAKSISVGTAVKELIEGLVSTVASHSGADRVGYPAGSNTWADGSTFDAAGQARNNLWKAIDGIRSDLAGVGASANSGAFKIGYNPQSTNVWANSDIIDRTVSGDTVPTPNTLANVISRIILDLARTSDGVGANEDPGANRIGIPLASVLTSTLLGDSSGNYGRLWDWLTAVHTWLGALVPRDKDDNLGGLFDLLSAATKLATPYISDSTATSSPDLSGADVDTSDPVFNYLFRFGSGTRVFRVYCNDHVWMLTYNARWVVDETFNPGSINITNEWHADDDTQMSMALMVGDCHEGLISTGTLSVNPIFDDGAATGTSNEGELAFPQTADLSDSTPAVIKARYQGEFGLTNPVPFLVLVRAPEPTTISNPGNYDDGLRVNYRWSHHIQNSTETEYGWYAGGFRFKAANSTHGGDYGMTLTVHTGSVAP